MTKSYFDGSELFGLPHSYYTVIAQSYLRKQGAALRLASPFATDFQREILPRIGRTIIPVLRTPSGEIIQDSLDIIEHGETNSPAVPAIPPGARQTLISALFFHYGSQALLKPAMHYRWSFYDNQKKFLDHAFRVDVLGEAAMEKMKGYLPVLGVTPETIPIIEANFLELLDLLEVHFTHNAYLLGGQPTLGDYGMVGPLFAHLGRDPVPAGVMKSRAPNVFRWIERMMASEVESFEFPHKTPLSDDTLPETLMPLIAFIGRDYGPELSDRIAFLREYLLKTDPEDGAPVSDKPARRAIGTAPVRYGGEVVNVAIQPYLLYCQRRVEAAFHAMTPDDQAWTKDLFAQNSLGAMIAPDLPMTVGRCDNIEVWEAYT